MRKRIGLGLTAVTFALGLLLGVLDSRTAHLVVEPAHAMATGPVGSGGTGGCGMGAWGPCVQCASNGGHGSTCQPGYCIGGWDCDAALDGPVKLCIEVGACGGGSTSLQARP